MGLFKLLFPLIDTWFVLAEWTPLEDIKANNQALAKELTEGQIKVNSFKDIKNYQQVSKPEMVRRRRESEKN